MNTSGAGPGFLFILDPLETLKPYKDSSIAMMRALAARGATLWACTPAALCWDGAQVNARVERLQILPGSGDDPWFEPRETAQRGLASFAAVLMRKDPPVDSEYLYATHLLSAAVRGGARVYNAPEALRNHNEKLAITEFAQFTAPTEVTRDLERIRDFLRAQGLAVLKPLHGMGGAGVFRLSPGDPNLNAILETATDDGQRTVMVQRFLPQIADGDKRILLIDGAVVPYALARIPRPGESRGNLAAGGIGRAQPLDARDQEIAQALAPVLSARGLLVVGLDVIGTCLTEINVTSPTCFVEIEQQTGYDVAGQFAEALLRKV